MKKSQYVHLDEHGRLGNVSADSKTREAFDKSLTFAMLLGFNRSKFIVMAVIMAALDLGMEIDHDKENAG